MDAYFGVAIGETFARWVDSPKIDFGYYFTDVADALAMAIGEIFINGTDPAQALSCLLYTSRCV